MNGASIMPRSKLVNAEFARDKKQLSIEESNGQLRYANGDQLVNAAVPMVDQVLRQALGRNDSDNIRLVGGSHIVIKRKLPDPRAYFFPNRR